ncbi:hypothetical protein [Legionella spiritensis]|uniref:Uncharacterized protein n=1 Tax=Legionella spiritensis TaxID=452 RepID=A0A0W0YWG8_LEGSP|nr:hypothetical protein [Legionella spiritensis]KTD61192.1 hypothetical protein Lspi_2812 [Legionella spiritensis]SNV28391.1 Uncharacterised protein [Legionella spiritensis]
MPGYHQDWVRGPDAPHIKRNHTNEAEVPIAHFHREFESEVTPELLALYLNNIYTQQQEHYEESVKDYSFFENEGEVEEIIEKFTIYYKEYEKSDVEKLFNDETKLTPEEIIAYETAVSEHNEEKFLMEEMAQIFIQQMFFKPPTKGRSILFNYNLEPTEESDSRPECVLM